MIMNLHTYTDNGSLESLISVDELVGIDSPALSIFDPSMFNVINFYRKCKESNKKPIIGLDCYLAWGENADSLIQKYGTVYSRLGLVAINRQGYENLVKLSTYSYSHFYQKPRIDWDSLYLYGKGLVCLLHPVESAIAQYVAADHIAAALNELVQLHFVFDEVYWENIVQYKATDKFIKFMSEQGIKAIASSHAQYMKSEDFDTWKIMLAINKNTNPSMVSFDNNFYYRDNLDILPLGDVVELYSLIDKVQDYGLDRVDIKLPDQHITDEEFIFMLKDRLTKFSNDKKYLDRLDYELSIILKFGYKDYFLLVKNLIDYCNEKLSGYLSAGRGSVGGSLIAYLLGITRIDPINPMGFDMEIPFDRFLNSGRKVMPDIDLDFLPRDRGAIIQYLKDSYGENSCKNIATVVTLGARSSIREVCRITGNLTEEIEAIIKSFPHDQHLTLKMIKDTDIYKNNINNSVFMKMFEVALQLEGTPKSMGVHASGVALASEEMTNIVPFFIFNGKEITQYGQDDLEYLGIIKLDILGLNTLQIVYDTLNLMGIDDKVGFLNSIPVDDPDVYSYLNFSDIAGVFQWDTYNYKKVIKGVKPSNFKELVDLNTLGRSAALLSGLTDMYIDRKNNMGVTIPLHEKLRGLMKQTYELPLYQEQIMQLFIHLAGYSSSEADDVRKAVGKKLPELMEKQKSLFIGRSIDKGMTYKESEEIWSVIDKFSKYTWNLGHAMSYTRICYETAYLAYKYSAEYYSACINNAESSNEAGRFLSVLKKMKIKISKVDINKSDLGYKVENGVVIAGLAGLAFCGDKTLESLLKYRKDGIFKDIQDFDNRVPKKEINKKSLASLYVNGAFDSMKDIDVLLKRMGIKQEELLNLKLEQYRVGGKVVHDPMLLLNYDGKYIKDLSVSNVIHTLAYLISIREIFTKTHKKMAFSEFEDINGRWEVVWFPEAYENFKVSIGGLYKLSLKYNNGIVGLKAEGLVI